MIRRMGWAVPVALAMFLGGATGILHLVGPEGAQGPAVPGAATLVGPTLGGALTSTITGLQARAREHPRDWRSLASLGLAYLQRGRVTADPSYYPKAQAILARSLRIEPTSFDATLGSGILALARHDFIRGLRWGRRAAELNPYSGPARGVVGDALLELGRYRAAGREYQTMVDLRPDLLSYARVSYYRELTGDTAGAIAAMRMARDVAGTPADAAWAGYQVGELYFGTGRPGPAARAFRTAAVADPSSVLPRAGMAKVAAARGRWARAISLFQGAVQRYPAPDLVILLGDVAAAAGREGLAADQYALVGALERLYRDGGVDTDLEMALFAADHGVDPAATVSRALAAYRTRPSVQAADALGWALHAAGRDRAADRLAREALRLGTRSASFHFHAGMIAAGLGQEARAERHLRAALAINPWFSFVHAGLARETLAEISR
jgi:tetratricopeptide (TPR) repeat protein